MVRSADSPEAMAGKEASEGLSQGGPAGRLVEDCSGRARRGPVRRPHELTSEAPEPLEIVLVLGTVDGVIGAPS